jgi:hypothetical protein
VQKYEIVELLEGYSSTTILTLPAFGFDDKLFNAVDRFFSFGWTITSHVVNLTIY